MTYQQGINFRDTLAYVTDGASESCEFGTGSSYPRTTAQGNTVGWESPIGNTRDRSTSVDRRLAGIHFTSSVQADFRFDLPAAGSYNIRAAFGDMSSVNDTLWTLLDTTTALATLATGNNSSAGSFKDATDTVRTAAAWPGSNAAVTKTFSTTICRIRGSSAAAANLIAHAYVESAGGGTTVVTLDSLLRSEWSCSRQRDSVIPNEFLRAASTDMISPTNWLAPVQSDARTSADWISTVVVSGAASIELTMALRTDQPLPAEWTGAVNVAADSNMPLEWRTQVSADARALADWLMPVRADAQAAEDFGAQLLGDARVGVALSADVQVDGIALADWTGAVAVSADSRAPVEWSGGVLVTANAVLPIEFGASVVTDARIQVNWSAAFIGDRQMPAEFNVGVIANQQGALDWLRTVFGDAVAPGETLVVISGSSSAPAEFGGASAFVPGNSEIFRVDARGYIWRVDARSTIWLPATR